MNARPGTAMAAATDRRATFTLTSRDRRAHVIWRRIGVRTLFCVCRSPVHRA